MTSIQIELTPEVITILQGEDGLGLIPIIEKIQLDLINKAYEPEIAEYKKNKYAEMNEAINVLQDQYQAEIDAYLRDTYGV